MATVPSKQRTREIEYPTGDGKPMAETELHLYDMIDSIQVLKDYYAGQPRVYVCGNMLMFYEEGNPRKHVSPDVFVVHGIATEPLRDNYLVWKEGKAPDFIVEITSKSTKAEDRKKKFEIYRTILRVPEYFLFDPTEDYLKPPLQGFRLAGEQYVPIEPVDGRLPSQVLGLHLERDGQQLRFFNPATSERLMTRLEMREAAERAAIEERDRAQQERDRAEREHNRAEQERNRAEQERNRAEQERNRADVAEAAERRLAAEIERLRQEIEALHDKKA
jgi:Uma2 family endonuclease